jgi:hypothetical protein
MDVLGGVLVVNMGGIEGFFGRRTGEDKRGLL